MKIFTLTSGGRLLFAVASPHVNAKPGSPSHITELLVDPKVRFSSPQAKKACRCIHTQATLGLTLEQLRTPGTKARGLPVVELPLTLFAQRTGFTY